MVLNNQQLEQNFRATQLRVNENQGLPNDGTGIQGQAVLPPRFTPIVPGVTPQVANQLRNGDLGHSVFTWFETVLPYTDPENQECAWVFSNTIPVNGQALSFENSFTDPGNPNTTLKTPTHTDYDPALCDWDSTEGVARLTGTASLDLPWPSNITGPGKTEYIVFIAARRTPFISLPRPFRIGCGIWDNTMEQRDFIQSGTVFTLNGGTIGIPAATTEYRYKVHARTDRGYSFLSTELILANSPTAGAFVSNQVYNSLNWDLANNAGILSYDVIRYDVAFGQYWLLEQVTNGARSYVDQNTMLRQVAGYPTATYDHGIAYVATTSGNLTNLAVNGVSDKWSTLIVPIQLPVDYNQGNTSATDANQVLRIFQNQAADVLVTAQFNSGSSTIKSNDGQFTVEMEGLMVTVTDGDSTQTVELDTYISEIEFTTLIPLTFTAKTAQMLIIGGGFHGVLLDLIHASFQGGSTWSPNAQDDRILQPIAAPDGSTQGGTGIGGSGNESGGDGGIRCLAEGYPVLTVSRAGRIVQSMVETLNQFFAVESETPTAPNYIHSNEQHWCANIWRVETERWEIKCSPSHPLITSQLDRRGVRVDLLKPGDLTLTEVNGRIGREALTVCEATGRGGYVRQISLYPRHNYIAGKAKLTFWQKLFRRKPVGGFVQSNVKPQQEPTQNQS